MKILRFGVLVLGLAQLALGFEDPFKNYLTALPTLKTVLSEENSGTGSSAITTKKFTFASKNGANTVYGYIVRPQALGVFPGLFIMHGGGQNAEGYLPMAQDFASRGYVVVAVGLPGICGTDNTPNSFGAWKSAAPGDGLLLPHSLRSRLNYRFAVGPLTLESGDWRHLASCERIWTAYGACLGKNRLAKPFTRGYIT